MATCLTSNEVCNVDRVCRNGGIGTCPLGTNMEGGYLAYKYGGGIALIIAPCGTTVLRTWYARNDAVTTAQNTSPCCQDWYIPSWTELRFVSNNFSYWDGFCPSSRMWSDTDSRAAIRSGATVVLCTNIYNGDSTSTATFTGAVRAVRKIYY